MSVWRRVAIAAGAAGALVGAGFAAERGVARRLRRRADPDGPGSITAEYDTSHRLPSHDGGELFVVERGAGPVVLLSHGVTLSVRTWAYQLHDLSDAGFRVVAFDHRGHGASTIGHAGHSVENLGADLRSVVEGLDLHDVVLVGHSMGGVAAQSLSINHPDVVRERLAGLVLLSSLARGPLSGSPRLAAASSWIADHLPDGAAVLRARDLGLVLARLGFGRDPAPDQVEATRQMILDTHPATRRDAIAALAGLDLTSWLDRITVPTLVVCGSSDLLTPLAESRRIADGISGARLEVVEGGGHMLMFERAALISGLITDFAHEVQHPGVVAAGGG